MPRPVPAAAFLAFLGLSVGLLPGPATGPVAAQDFARYEVELTPLTDHLHHVRGAGGNMVLWVGEEGVVLVDDDYTEMFEKVVAAVAAVTDSPVRFVLNTHWHFDHTGGNEGLAERGATLIAHRNVRERLAAGQLITLIDHQEPPAPPAALPGVTFTDTFRLHLGTEEILVCHPPAAHTDGDAVVFFRQANVVHAGDLFFNCGYPFIDVSSGGTIDGLIAAVSAILALCDNRTRIVPGHGPLAGKEDLATYLDLLREFREIVAGEVAAGKSLEEIRAARPTAALDEKWGRAMFPPEMFTEMVYLTLPGR